MIGWIFTKVNLSGFFHWFLPILDIRNFDAMEHEDFAKHHEDFKMIFFVVLLVFSSWFFV